MTDRRRFFPAKTVQQVPGQKVEVEIELKKGGEAPAAPCAPTGVFFGARSALVRTEEIREDKKDIEFNEWFPDFRSISGKEDEEGNWVSFVEKGTAWTRPEYYQDYLTDVGERKKAEIIQTAAILAVPIGPSCGLTWSLGWEGYKPNRHIEFSQDGPVAIIHVRTIEGVNEYNQGTAILTASCAGKAVGTLRLVIMPDEIW